MATTFILVLAVVFGALATARVPELPRFSFLGAALTMLALAFLLGHVPALR